MSKWTQIPSDKIIAKTISALKLNGIDVVVVDNKDQAKEKVMELIPEGSEVMEASSTTLTQIGLLDEIHEYGKYDSVKKKLNSLSRDTDHLEMQKLGAAPQYVIGSVHAITEDGKVIAVSRTGSQLASYIYGATKVIWVVSAKKIVKDQEEGFKRIYEHVLPLESKRVQKAYGMPNSEVGKVMIINKEVNPDRIKIVLVKEDLGF